MQREQRAVKVAIAGQGVTETSRRGEGGSHTEEVSRKCLFLQETTDQSSAQELPETFSTCGSPFSSLNALLHCQKSVFLSQVHTCLVAVFEIPSLSLSPLSPSKLLVLRARF